MSQRTMRFRALFARRLPDPVFHSQYGSERHLMLCAIRDIPRDVPTDPNARSTNTRRRVYREVEACLLNQDGEPNTFHLKNKGITIVAESVTRVSGTEDEYDVVFDDGHGILDGGHTYELLMRHKEDPALTEEQCVKVEFLTKIPYDWIPEISGGLNTSVQVQESSLMNLDNAFDWIKTEISKEPYAKSIAWSENEPGEYDARDIISIMTCFNIDYFPNRGESQPVEAYTSKAKALSRYKDDFDTNGGRSYRRLRPILRDILTLHDMIRYEFRDVHTKEGGRGGALKIVEKRDKPFDFLFIGKKSEYRLTRGALYPILAAFRWMIEEDAETGDFRWKHAGFQSVIDRWNLVKGKLVNLTYDKAIEVGRKPDAIGKSKAHWSSLHKEVAFVDLMQLQ